MGFLSGLGEFAGDCVDAYFGGINGYATGLVICGILSIIIGFCLLYNHVTRIIEIVIGAIHCYFFLIDGFILDKGENFINGLISAFFIFDFFAVLAAITEIFCLINLIISGIGIDTKPSTSDYMKSKVGYQILSFLFRR